MNQKSVNNLIKMYQQGKRFDRQKASNLLWIFYKEWLEEMRGQWRTTNYKRTLKYLELYLLPEFSEIRMDLISKSQIMKLGLVES